jgi:DNA-binding transcriptional ArsR family regulator
LTPSRAARNLLIIVNEKRTDAPASRTHGPDLILHPIRMRLILALGAGVPMAAAQLLERMPDVPPATLYRHLTVLRQGGIITFADEPGPRETGERRTRGAVERRFVLRAGAASLAPEDLASATPDDHLRWFASFLASLLGSFSRYVGAGVPDLARDGVGYREVVLQLSDDELVQMSIALNTALMPFVANVPGNGRTARLFATVLLPADPVPAGHINGSAE